MMPASTSLISPYSHTLDEEVAALSEIVAVMETDTFSADQQAEREARIAELRARKDSRRAARQMRRDERRARRVAARIDMTVDPPKAPRPQLQVKLITSVDEGTGHLFDTVKVTNLDDRDIVLTQIDSLEEAEQPVALPASEKVFKLSPGESYLLVSGLGLDGATPTEFRWSDKAACSENFSEGGYRVKAAFSGNTVNRGFVVRCAPSQVASVAEAPPRRRKR